MTLEQPELQLEYVGRGVLATDKRLQRLRRRAVVCGILSLCVPVLSGPLAILVVYISELLWPKTGWDVLGNAIVVGFWTIFVTVALGFLISTFWLFRLRGKPVGRLPWVLNIIGSSFHGLGLGALLFILLGH